ncbi:MAG: hypothetical protein Q9224_003683 [Gallowayella concinna]
MHFQSLLSVSLLAASAVSRSLPTTAEAIAERNLVGRNPDECGDDDNGISKRAECAQPVQCGPEENRQAYTPESINAAVKDAESLISKDQKKAPSPYPRKGFGARESSIKDALPDECKADVGDKKGLVLWEYPILNAGLYDGGDPREDRVLIADYKGDRTYCLTISHRGLGGNEHGVCPPTTA